MAESATQATAASGTDPRYNIGYGAISKPSDDVSSMISTETGDVGSDNDGGVSTSESDDAQEGVRTIEAVSMTWTKWGLIFAYMR